MVLARKPWGMEGSESELRSVFHLLLDKKDTGWLRYNEMRYNTIRYDAIRYDTTSFTSNIEQHQITPTICTTNCDSWEGGGQKNNLIVVHPNIDLYPLSL